MTPSASFERPPERSTRHWIFFCITIIGNGLLLWHFHDRYWYPTDDGLHAHIAERLLAGEVLNRDVQDIHPGYVHFLNLAAFRVFGVDMVSLRYPLIAGALCQSLLIYGLLLPRGPALAALTATAATALGVVQFMSPTANWYALNVTVALACWMTWVPARHWARLVGAGFLLGTVTLFRQLTGVWVAMAVLVLVLLEESQPEADDRSVAGRALVLIMLAAALGYLALSPETNVGGVVLIAAWPVGILAWALYRTCASDARVLSGVGKVALGASIASLPLVAYHVTHDSLGSWLNDIVFVATGHTQLPHFGQGWYGVLPLAALYQAVSSAEPIQIANGLYWLAISLMTAVHGGMVVGRLHRSEEPRNLTVPIIATFYALVSLYLQGPLYLYYTVGLTLTSVLWLEGSGPGVRRRAWGTVAGGLAVVAIVFHAGQSRHRTPTEILRGHRDTNIWIEAGAGLPRARLHLSDSDRHTYGHYIDVVERNSDPGESILALPNDSELYFLAKRTNATRFYNSTMGLMTPADVIGLQNALASRPPRLVIFRPQDKFVTEQALAIMNVVRSNYEKLDVFDGAEVYKLPLEHGAASRREVP